MHDAAPLSRRSPVIGTIVVLAGLVMIAAAVAAWILITTQLRAENIVVGDAAPFLAGATVADPLSAFAQAQVLAQDIASMSGGQSFADLAMDDPIRESVYQATTLRASLFTSVMAYGLAAFVAGSGIVTALIGWALRRR
ncbi:hypothetical protein [Microbacterium indicum]|uniref:hypothetical protein n=1 Tax=Microbacterium indicum TaxID=358100 RepID=UPI0003F4B557|nr:hypothetical protein [Microbacterium indicum]